MPATRGRYLELLQPGARKVFVDDYQGRPAEYTNVFNVLPSQKAFEDDLVMTGLSVAVKRGEGEAIAFDRPEYRGKVRYLHTGYGLGYEITDEAVDDDQYAVLNSKSAKNLSWSMRETENITAFNILNNGFSSVTTYDSVSLFNANHLGIGSVSQSNTAGAADLSLATLKAATQGAMSLTNDRGLYINIQYTDLITSPSLYWLAAELLQTQYVTGAASGGATTSVISDRVKNVITMMGLTPHAYPYIVDTNAWFLRAPKAAQKAFFFWRTKPQMTNGRDDLAKLTWAGVTARWSTGATDWRGWYGGSGT